MNRSFTFIISAILGMASSLPAALAGDDASSWKKQDSLIEFLAPSREFRDQLGERKVAVALRYSERLDPDSFRARAGGEDVSDRFKPVPGSVEVVILDANDRIPRVVFNARSVESDSTVRIQSAPREFVQAVRAGGLRAPTATPGASNELPDVAQDILRERKRSSRGNSSRN